jgi:hypothetical protein
MIILWKLVIKYDLKLSNSVGRSNLASSQFQFSNKFPYAIHGIYL